MPQGLREREIRKPVSVTTVKEVPVDSSTFLATLMASPSLKDPPSSGVHSMSNKRVDDMTKTNVTATTNLFLTQNATQSIASLSVSAPSPDLHLEVDLHTRTSTDMYAFPLTHIKESQR